MSEPITVLDHGYVGLVQHMGDEKVIINSARASYGKEITEITDKDRRLLKYLWEHKHFSVFRHCAFTFQISAPLLVSQQWYKHSVASAHWESQNGWNQQSFRYVSGGLEFYVPEEWRSKPANSKQGSGVPIDSVAAHWQTSQLTKHYEQSLKLYNEALADNVAPEQARLFLSGYALYQSWYWTTSLEGVLNFLTLRQADDSQWEIRQYADAVRELITPLFPTIISALGSSSLDK